MTFGAGVSWLARCFEETLEEVQTQGYLTPDSLQTTIKLFGVSPTRERITQDLMAYVVNLYNLACTPGTSSAVIEDWLKEENRPDVLKGRPDDEVMGSDPDHNQELLETELETEIERLRAEERRLSVEVDRPSLTAALQRVSILTDADARRVARSHSEARTTYHRSAKDLWPLLEREKQEGPPEPTGDDDGEHAGDEPAGEIADEPGCDAGGVVQPAAEWVEVVPVSGCRVEADGSQNEPEDSAVASTQLVEGPVGSVDGGPSAPGRQNRVLGGAPALENTPPEARVAGCPAEGQGIEPGGETQPVPERVPAVPAPASREEAYGSQNEPEKVAVSLRHKGLMSKVGSVDGQPSAPGRQNGVLGPVPALENRPVEEGIDPGSAAQPLPRWALAALLAARRPDSLLNEEARNASNGSAQVVDTQTSPVDAWPLGPGGPNGVPGGSPAVSGSG